MVVASWAIDAPLQYLEKAEKTVYDLGSFVIRDDWNIHEKEFVPF
jgi:hypothetical protein